MGSDKKNLVEHFKDLSKDDPTFTQNYTKIAQDISEASMTITDLVEELGSLLTDTVPAQRELGTYILTKVIENLPTNLLSSAQITFISSFYADRLKDNHQVIPAVIEGVLALSKCKNLPDSSVPVMLKAIFDNVPCQQQQKQDRLNLFIIFQNLLENKLAAMLAMELNLVYGVISAVDGERDPQNLHHLFRWLPTFIKTVKLGQLTEEMFEIMACYFPVDFKNPTATDDDVVNRISLSTALAPCLCAIPQFDEFCIPLLLEKLSSSLVIAKLDSLALLIESCKVFNRDIYLTHSTDIYTQTINEIHSSKDVDIETAAAKALTAFIRKITLSASVSDEHKEKVDDIINSIITNVRENLRADQVLFASCVKTLLAVSSGSKYACASVTKFVLPLFVNQFNMTSTVSHQVVLFNALIDFVQIYADLNETESLADVVDLADVPGLCLKASVSEDLEVRATGLRSLNLLCKMLPFEVRQCVYKNIGALLVVPQPKNVRHNLLKCFETFSKVYAQEVQNLLLPEISINGTSALRLYLEALTRIALQTEFVDTVLPLLCQYCVKDLSSARIASECLKALLHKERDSAVLHDYLFCDQRLVQKLIDFSLNCISDMNDATSKEFLLNASCILAQLIGFRNSHEQQMVLNEQMTETDSVLLDFGRPICPFLLSGLLMNVRRDVEIPHKQTVIVRLIKTVPNFDVDYVQTCVVQLISNVLNKLDDEAELQRLLEIAASECEPSVLSGEPEKCSCRLSLASWITKALVLRQHQSAELWSNKMLEMLGTHKSMAVGFKLIICDENTCLAINNYCTVKLLHKQKFFSAICDKLIRKYDAERNLNYLFAFGYLLQEAPIEIILIYFQKILKLIVLCLDFCVDPELLSTVLNKINYLINNKNLLMGEYIQEFLPRFLNLTTFKSCLKVRIAAIQCIENYTKDYPLYKLLPHKQKVVHTLGTCVDDPKRVVRKEAVSARNCWFLLDAPS